MPTLGKLWAGYVYGTNTGKVFVEFEADAKAPIGILRFNDSDLGTTVYKIEGSFDGAKLEFKGEPVQAREGVVSGSLTAVAAITPEGQLRGQWSSSLGTGGTFVLFPHETATPTMSSDGSSIPPQLHSANRQLGVLRLYADDLRELIGHVRKDFNAARLVVTYEVHGNELSQFVEDFEKSSRTVGEIRRLRLFIQEHEAHGINKLVTVDLNAQGSNEVRVQGINESWVLGKVETIVRQLRQFESNVVTTYKKFGLGINQVVFLAMLVALPDVPSLEARALLVGIVTAMLAMLYSLHSEFIPNTLVVLGPKKPGLLKRFGPTLVSWLSATTAALVSALAFWWLTEGVKP